MAVRDLGNGKFRIDLRIGGRRGTRHRATIEATPAQAREAHADLLRVTKGCTGATLRDAYVHTMAVEWGDNKDKGGINDRWRVLTALLPDSTRLADIDSAAIVGLLTSLRSRGISATTINKYLSLLRVLLKEASRAKPALISEDDLPRIPHLKETQKKRRPLKADEEQAVIAWLCSQDEAKWGEFRDFVLFQLDAGTRRSEALKIERVDVDLRAGKYGRIRIRDPKNGEERRVPLCDRSRALVERRLPKGAHDKLFPSISPPLIQKRWSELRTALGIEDVTIHGLRHTAGRRIIEATGNLRAAQVVLGHKDVATTVRYTDVSSESLDQVAEALSAATTHPQPEAD